VSELGLNIIYLENWYNQPIHCPFCGQASDVEFRTGEVDCRHWLYTKYFEFLERSDRFECATGLPWGDEDADLTGKFEEKFGSAQEIVERNREKFFNLVEYQVNTASDIALIGFAPIDEELVAWGREEISPYEEC
jgi:hypothetical protein